MSSLVPRLPLLQLTSESEAAPDRAYWVVKPWLLAGAYPGHPDAVKHAARVHAIRAAGCTTFVNLVQEDEINNGGQPFRSYVEALDACEGFVERVSCLRFPVKDLWVPSRAMMRGILDAIDLSLEARRAVFVHCFGGVGRTATVVGCWMIRHGLASSADVMSVLARLRTADKVAGKRDAPESPEQKAFVRAWTCGA